MSAHWMAWIHNPLHCICKVSSSFYCYLNVNSTPTPKNTIPRKSLITPSWNNMFSEWVGVSCVCVTHFAVSNALGKCTRALVRHWTVQQKSHMREPAPAWITLVAVSLHWVNIYFSHSCRCKAVIWCFKCWVFSHSCWVLCAFLLLKLILVLSSPKNKSTIITLIILIVFLQYLELNQ